MPIQKKDIRRGDSVRVTKEVGNRTAEYFTTQNGNSTFKVSLSPGERVRARSRATGTFRLRVGVKDDAGYAGSVWLEADEWAS
ncbi:MAG: hypothetical protein ICCCNLDF_03580 [Planctomycetes bacterium]|nr:hypothetical protein [Planctomycetota bacterium]